ncbi:MAG: VirB4 family type IV secretion system protein [Candidatus Dormibacteria bacterium]
MGDFVASIKEVLSARGRVSPAPFSMLFERGPLPSQFRFAGVDHCVIATGAFDLVEASPDSRRHQVDLFEDLLNGIELPFQLVVRSVPGRVRIRPGKLHDHLAARAAAGGFFTREVHLVLSRPGTAVEALTRRLRQHRATDEGAPTELARAAARVAGALQLMRLRPEILAGRRLDRFLYDRLPAAIMHPALASHWRERPDRFELDTETSRTFFLQAFPGTELEAGWLGSILDLPLPYEFAIHGSVLPAAALLRMLNGRIRDLTAARMAEGGAGADPLVEAGLPEALGLRREVVANQQRAVGVGVYLTVFGPDLAGEATLLEAAASRALGIVLPATLQMAAGRIATLPLGTDTLHQERILPSATAATLFPWLWDELQQADGNLVGFQQRSGLPVVIDTFDEDRFTNANIGVFGHSGAGKTHLVKALLLADAAAGVGAFVVDPEAEYRGLCEAVKGQWVDLALGAGHSINVLDPALGVSGERDPLGDQVSDLVDLLGEMCGQLTDDDRVELDEVLRPLLLRGGATLCDLRDELSARQVCPRLCRGLRRWTEGPLGALFGRPTNVRLESEFVVFGLRDVKEEFLPVVYFLIAQWVWSRVRAEPRRRRLLFDEVGLLFEHPPVRRFLVRLARRVRKYNASLCLVTQNAGDLLASEAGLVLATNPATLFLGAQRQAEAMRMQRAFGLTDRQAEWLAIARRGEFLLLAGDGRHRLRVEAPPWFEAVLRPGVCQTSPDAPERTG